MVLETEAAGRELNLITLHPFAEGIQAFFNSSMT